MSSENAEITEEERDAQYLEHAVLLNPSEAIRSRNEFNMAKEMGFAIYRVCVHGFSFSLPDCISTAWISCVIQLAAVLT